MSEKEKHLFVKRDKKTNEFRSYKIFPADEVDSIREAIKEHNGKVDKDIVGCEGYWEDAEHLTVSELARIFIAVDEKWREKPSASKGIIDKLKVASADLHDLIRLLEREDL